MVNAFHINEKIYNYVINVFIAIKQSTELRRFGKIKVLHVSGLYLSILASHCHHISIRGFPRLYVFNQCVLLRRFRGMFLLSGMQLTVMGISLTRWISCHRKNHSQSFLKKRIWSQNHGSEYQLTDLISIVKKMAVNVFCYENRPYSPTCYLIHNCTDNVRFPSEP